MSKTFILPEGSFDFEEIANLSGKYSEALSPFHLKEALTTVGL